MEITFEETRRKARPGEVEALAKESFLMKHPACSCGRAAVHVAYKKIDKSGPYPQYVGCIPVCEDCVETLKSEGYQIM